MQVDETPAPTDFGLNGDNLDWIRRPSIYSKDRDTESIHWFNLLAYDNRVVNWELCDEDPIGDVKDLENSTFLPTVDDHAKLKDEFVILVLRVLVKNCKYFQQFSQLVPNHIPHPYSKEMSHQSQVVSSHPSIIIIIIIISNIIIIDDHFARLIFFIFKGVSIVLVL